LIYKVKVVQLHEIPVYVRITDLNGVPITELTFAADDGIGGAPAPQYFRVEWSPIDQPLEILSKAQVPGTDGAFSWSDACYTWTEISATYGGSAILKIDPSALPDPLDVYASTVTFKVNAGLAPTESIELCQGYMVAAAPEAEYLLDGSSTQMFTVKSNVGWQITGILDTAGIIDNAAALLAPSHSANKTPGEDVYLTMADYMTGKTAKSGTAIITITDARGEEYEVAIYGMSYWVKITDLSNTVIDTLDFAPNNGAGVPPLPQSFKVEWAPSDRALTTGTPTVTGPNGGFPWTSATTNAVTGIPANASPFTLDITPGVMTVDSDFKTIASLVTFTITGTTISESIMLRQINYNLIATADALYILDGQTKTFNVKSNMPWTVSVQSDTSGIIASLNNTGNTIAPTGFNKSFSVYNLMHANVKTCTAILRITATSTGQYVDLPIYATGRIKMGTLQLYPIMVDGLGLYGCIDYCASLTGGWHVPQEAEYEACGVTTTEVAYVYTLMGYNWSGPQINWWCNTPYGAGTKMIILYNTGGTSVYDAAYPPSDARGRCACVK
jgi:hypothetical protein